MPDERTELVACIPRLRRYARALVGNRPDADDLVQDTVERALAKLSLWRNGSDMRPWLFGIMHNLYVDQVRHPPPPTAGLDEQLQQAAPDNGIDSFEAADLNAALRRLPAEQREVLLLSALEDMTYAEIAASLHIPPGTVMSRLARARAHIKASLDGERPTLRRVK
jgi:RNA polymerase sigma factor (sigma-70 family)